MNTKHFCAAVILFLFLAVGIQPALGVDIPNADQSIGTWNEDETIYTLAKDFTEGLVIVQSNFILNGGDHTITGAGSGWGISLSDKTGVTVKNVTVQNFDYGIRLSNSSNLNEVSCNTVSNNGTNAMGGICLYQANGNVIKGNTISNNYNGIVLQTSYNNKVYNNNFLNNTKRQAYVISLDATSGNLFNLDIPIGGNYLSDWGPPDTGDSDNDGFWDDPYTIIHYPALPQDPTLRIQDKLPWTLPDGWLSPVNQPPVADALVNGQKSVTIEQESHAGTEVTLDATQSSDSDGDTLTYEWDFTSDGTVDSYQPVVAVAYNLGGPYTATLTVTDSDGASDTDTVTITVEDTTSPIISCPGDTTIVGLDGVPVEDERIQTFLNGASATDDCDSEPTIANDAPPTFLAGDTVVTFTATDASGNWSICESTVTVVEPAEAIEYIRDYIEQMDVPEDAEKEMGKAVKELNKAIDEFNNDRIDKALNNIAKAVKQLMKAQKEDADTQDVIDELVDLVQGIAEKAIEDAIGSVGPENLHVVKAQEHYDKALGNLADGKYDAAIKNFKNAYKEAMKALG